MSEQTSNPISGQNVPKSKFRKKSRQEQTAASKLRMERRGEKLDAAREKLAKQKPPKKSGAVKRLAHTAGHGVHGFVHEPTPQELLERMELFTYLWNALNSLPEVQGIRVEAHLILGMSYRQIAREQGVDKSAVRHSVKSGKAAMRKYLKKLL